MVWVMRIQNEPPAILYLIEPKPRRCVKYFESLPWSNFNAAEICWANTSPYLPASCQMNCSIPIWCHMCMEACSTSNRCCRNALRGDIGGKVICDSKHPKYQWNWQQTPQNISARLPLNCQGAGASKKLLCYFPGGRFGVKLGRMYEGEHEKW